MGKVAISVTDLNALVKKYRRGDSVLWEELVSGAKGKLYKFDGVGKINHEAFVKEACDKITDANKYVSTQSEVASLFGVSRGELLRWRNAGFITLEKKQLPKRIKLKFIRERRKLLSWVYDVMLIRKQVLLQLKRQGYKM